MKRMRQGGLVTLAALGWLRLWQVAAQGQSPGANSHMFRGRVVSVNMPAGKVSVANENIEGWMAAMTMAYKTDNPDMLKELKTGDTIAATVYDGDFTTLYGVRVETPAAAEGGDALPPISYVCPTPAEASYLDDKPGTCPVSGVALAAVRLVTAYSCLKNQVFIREVPGPCPTDRTEMVPITVAMSFTCRSDPSVRNVSPGACADGSARIKVFERRPHGDHNPRHGGDFIFMAADQWHHLEGTFVEPDLFRLYLYNDMTHPLSASDLSGRLTMADNNAHEIGSSIPLVLGKTADHSTLQARLPTTTFPFNVKLLMKFKPGDKEQVFDFTFREYSKEP